MKWQINITLAKRISERLRESSGDQPFISYEDVLDAMRAEDVARADSYNNVNGLRRVLRDAGDDWAANAIADAACREAQNKRSTIQSLQHGLSLIGLKFNEETEA